MLTAVKNQLRISLMTTKYALMREMLNKVSFITNILFMILNNASFIIEWIVLFSLKDNIGGYGLKQILLLWGMASGTYGISRFFFKKAFSLSEIINNGKLDAFLVQPKNVLLQAITTDVETSAIGDMLYGYIMLFIYGINFKTFFLYTFFIITGGLIITSVAIILGSFSFWINKSEIISDVGNSLIISFATYPDGIFKGVAKILLYTLIPIGITTYIPLKVIIDFNLSQLLIVIISTIVLIMLANILFNRGLKRYSSSNLMLSRI